MSNPTDTNQASELFELCREVYEKTGWKPTDWQHGDEGGQPLYTSDYLLEKLQQLANTDRNQLHLFTDTNNGYSAKMTISGGSYGEEDYHWYEISDGYGHRTPVLALLKLTIALSEAGELK